MAKLDKLIKRDNELAAEIDNIDNQILALRERQRKLAAEHSEVRSKMKVERKVAQFSDEERKALAQALGAKGVPSEENVGTPGA